MKIDTRAAALAAILALASPAAAIAQQAPAATGPYLWAQQEADHVVMVAMGTRAQSGGNWTATSITVFDLEDVGQVRVDSTVEVDCAANIRRTSDLSLYAAPDVDQPGAVVATIPGVAWSPPGPSDGPIMTYICTGQHDAAQVRDRISAQVAKWRASAN